MVKPEDDKKQPEDDTKSKLGDDTLRILEFLSF